MITSNQNNLSSPGGQARPPVRALVSYDLATDLTGLPRGHLRELVQDGVVRTARAFGRQLVVLDDLDPDALARRGPHS